ncbi:hypothetical protein MTO96_040254, partial [Rhipicephalus appendiculatus]
MVGYKHSTAYYTAPTKVAREWSPPLMTPLTIWLTAVLVFSASALVVMVLPAFLLLAWPPCREPRCFDYAHEMALSLNTTVQPCDDFYGYVCGGFAEQHPQHANFLSILDARLSLVRARLLDGAAAGFEETFVRRAVDAFRRCVDDYREGREDGLQQLRDFTHSIGIHWRKTPVHFTSFSLLGVLFKLSLRYGIPLLLNARLRAWPSVDSPSTLKAGLQLDFEPMDPPLVERTASSVEDLLRAVAHNSTMLRFKSIAADVRRAMDDLHLRLHEAAVPSGELLFVKVPNIESLLPLLKPAHFEALVNYFLEAPNKYTMSSEVVSATAALVRELAVFLNEEAPTGRALNLIRYLLFERLVPVATSDLEEALDLEAGEASKLRIRACMDAVRRVEPRTEVLSKRRVTQSARVVSAVLKATLAEYARWQDNVTLARTRARLKLLRAETSLTPLTSVADANRRYEYVVPVNDDTSFFKWFTSSLYKGATLAMSASVGKLRDGDDLRQ